MSVLQIETCIRFAWRKLSSQLLCPLKKKKWKKKKKKKKKKRRRRSRRRRSARRKPAQLSDPDRGLISTLLFLDST